MATTIKTTFLLKRGTAARWAEVNPILEQGEPGFAYDANIFKIGDGITPWLQLTSPTGGNDSIIFISTYNELPTIGQLECLYNVQDERLLYQWNGEAYEALGGGAVDLEKIIKTTKKIKFEIDYIPEGVIVNYTDSEIRILCPKDINFTHQTPGANGDVNKYYIGFRAYAPEEAHSFKEGLGGPIEDTIYTFDDEFSGIDKYGRKYSICWLPVASYNEQTAEWTYFGKNSSYKHYIGWDYAVEWYNTEGLQIGFNSIRINLSNESCHYNNEPYFMSSINISKLSQNEGQYLELYGGSATDNI